MIRPQTPDNAARIINPAARIAVGKRGTYPVRKYSCITGRPSISDRLKSTADIMEKHKSGRSSLARLKIVPKMRKPSRYVFSLETVLIPRGQNGQVLPCCEPAHVCVLRQGVGGIVTNNGFGLYLTAGSLTLLKGPSV